MCTRTAGSSTASGPLGPKQVLSLKSCLATQHGTVWLWFDHRGGYDAYEQNGWVRPLLPRVTVKRYDPAEQAAGTPLQSSALTKKRWHIVRMSFAFSRC